MGPAAKVFFNSKHFTVAGASQNSSKFGYKILAWYQAHSLPVTPINPSRPENTIGDIKCSTVSSPSQLSYPIETGLNVITQPTVTKEILKEAKEVGIQAVWSQPGSFDWEGLEYAVREFRAGVGGKGGAGSEGWCVLVDGAEMLAHAQKEQKRL